MCNMGHNTFVFEIDFTIMKVSIDAKTYGASRYARVIILTDAHTDKRPPKTLLPLLSRSLNKIIEEKSLYAFDTVEDGL